MADGVLFRPETADSLLGLLRDNVGRGRPNNNHAGVMGRVEIVRCVSLISASPIPHYNGSVRLVTDLTTGTSSTGYVVLASLTGAALVIGQDYTAVLCGGVSDVPIYWVGEAGGGTGGSCYAKLTGRSGTRYAFSEVAVDGSNAYGVVSGGRTGTTSVGYAQAINLVANDVLFTPTNQIFLLTPNPVVTGCWLFGPVIIC